MGIIVLAALLVVPLFWAVAVGRRRVAGWLLAILVPSGGLAVALGWAYNSSRCDEACATAPGWEATKDAWQWDALFWVPLIGLVALVVAALLTGARSRGPALFTLATAAVAFVAFAVLNAPLTSDY